MTVHKKLLIKLKVLNQILWSWCYYNEEKMLYQQGEKRWLLIGAKSWKIDCIDCSVKSTSNDKLMANPENYSP